MPWGAGCTSLPPSGQRTSSTCGASLVDGRAVGYALHGAGLLDATMVSGQLAAWEEPGIGRWITVYANSHHVYMVVAGLRFDTRDAPPGVSGPRWHRASVDASGFVARHPLGL